MEVKTHFTQLMFQLMPRASQTQVSAPLPAQLSVAEHAYKFMGWRQLRPTPAAIGISEIETRRTNDAADSSEGGHMIGSGFLTPKASNAPRAIQRNAQSQTLHQDQGSERAEELFKLVRTDSRLVLWVRRWGPPSSSPSGSRTSSLRRAHNSRGTQAAAAAAAAASSSSSSKHPTP